jgi:hypothetical protein
VLQKRLDRLLVSGLRDVREALVVA